MYILTDKRSNDGKRRRMSTNFTIKQEKFIYIYIYILFSCLRQDTKEKKNVVDAPVKRTI